MRTHSRKTLLQCLMAERRLTREQVIEALDRRARGMGVRDFALSVRQLDRWLAGDLATLPRPSLCNCSRAPLRLSWRWQRILGCQRPSAVPASMTFGSP